METIKLSIEDLCVKWATLCVDWFMNFFADPDYYWTDERYPNRKQHYKALINCNQHVQINKNSEKEEEPITCYSTKKETNQVSSFSLLNLKMINIQRIIETYNLVRNKISKSFLFNSPIVSMPFQFVYIWDKLKYNVSNSI